MYAAGVDIQVYMYIFRVNAFGVDTFGPTGSRQFVGTICLERGWCGGTSKELISLYDFRVNGSVLTHLPTDLEVSQDLARNES